MIDIAKQFGVELQRRLSCVLNDPDLDNNTLEFQHCPITHEIVGFSIKHKKKKIWRDSQVA